MSDERLHDLLSVLPDETEIRRRAARARERALAHVDEPEPVIIRQYVWTPALAVAALVLIVAGVLFRVSTPVAPATPAVESAQAKRQPDRLRMKWVLSDGTRVLWTFREDL